MQSLSERLASIKDGWDLAASEDAIHYILGSTARRGVNLEAFLDVKSKQAEEHTADFLREMDFDPAGKRMLDIGCGIGGMARYFSRVFAEAHGVDISEEMIRRAVELHTDRENLHFRAISGSDLSPYGDNFFDFCFSFATFQYLPSTIVLEKWFREIARVLKPRGLFKAQLDGRRWIASRTPIPIYRPLYNFLRNSCFLTVFGRLITDGITVKAYRGMAVSWRTVADILQPLPFGDINVSGENTSHMWVSGRKEG